MQSQNEVLAYMKSMAFKQQRMHVYIRGGIVKTLIAVTVALQLVACGGGGGGGSSSGANNSAQSSNVKGSSADAGATVSSSSTSATTPSSQPSASATGTLTLKWVAPVARADGTPLSLSDIDGYRIYYGNSAGNYPYSVSVSDATTQQVIVKNLASGIYYVVMTTYDVDGRESGYSVVVKKSVS